MKKINKEKIKTWFVTGASSGVGHELCKQLLDRDYNVVAVSRRIPDFKHKNAFCLSCDVTDPESVNEAINKGIEHFGRIDVVSNNAGISSYLTAEEETLEEMKRVMDVNFWGTYNVIKTLLPHFRQNNNGTIINNSSECGIIPRAFGAAYCSSKHAVEGLSSALWHETKRFCRVMTVELSFFEGTEIGKGKTKGASKYDEYKKLPWLPVKIRNKYKNNLCKAVKIIIDTAEAENMQRRLMLGRDIPRKILFELCSMGNDLFLSLPKAVSCGKKLNRKEHQ